MIKRKINAIIAGYMVLAPNLAFAAGSGMPWENPFDQVLNSLTGPVLRFGTITAVVLLGLTLAFFEVGGFFRKVILVVIGLSVSCAATGWGLTFFGFSGGLLV